MAERIVSPGVFTQERDLSFLPQGVAQIGAAFIGPTTKGPAFIPTQVLGIDGFVTTFGEPDGTSYTGYTVKNYLQEAGSATVVRVLGMYGYTKDVVNVYVTGSLGKKIFATLHPTISGSVLDSATIGGTPSGFSLLVVGDTTTSASGLTVTETSPSFLGSYFGYDAQSMTSQSVYTYAIFPDAFAQAGSAVTMSVATASMDLTDSYTNASTPWIRSQTIGATKHDLFKIHTLGDGTYTNTEFKVSIIGISPSTDDTNYGTFTLLLREFGDTDSSPNVIEQYDNLNLNPDSPNYIARRIGNSAPVYKNNETYYEGDFPNISKHIRIEMTENTVPDSAVPYGFAAVNAVIPANVGEVASGSYVKSRWLLNNVPGYTTQSVDKRYYYGYDFSNTTSVSYLAPIVGTLTVGDAFSLEGIADVPSGSAPWSASISLDDRTHTGYRRFTVPFQGGFDGLNPSKFRAMGGSITSTNTLGFDLSTSTADGSKEYKRALDALSNPDSIDLNLLVIPGVIYSQHSYVAQSAIDLCESRGDCFYILDLDTLEGSVTSAATEAEELDTNYAAAYYPWVRITDTNTNKMMWVPPSVVLPEVYAYNDAVGAEWFAPAGLNRGGVPGAVGVKARLNQAQRDELYESKVNPIAQFPGQGICVWGQKTLQRRASALDRVNVRRLLITVKKYIASSARYLVFEQNTEATRNRFLNIVNPYLSGIQQRSGLTAFRVVMDETNNTPDIIDRNILAGAIYLQPTRTAEFIKLDFNILPTGATFDTI